MISKEIKNDGNFWCKRTLCRYVGDAFGVKIYLINWICYETVMALKYNLFTSIAEIPSSTVLLKYLSLIFISLWWIYEGSWIKYSVREKGWQVFKRTRNYGLNGKT